MLKKIVKGLLKIKTEKALAQQAGVLIPSREGYFDESSIQLLDTFSLDEGVLIVYWVKKTRSIGAALFDKKDPTLLLWRTANPIFQAKVGFTPHEIAWLGRDVVIHFQKGRTTEKINISLDHLLHKCTKPCGCSIKPHVSAMQRSPENPIIVPDAAHSWENCATFNAAAIYLNGKVHFLYRAIGDLGMSVLGYAASRDGIHIDERLPAAVYIPTEPFEFRNDKNEFILFDYASGGGGWGGCEDPRLTCIDDRIYMTYTAFNGVEAPGVALTSINVKDFLNKKWHWRKPVLISPRGQINKNWVIFPEKIKGKYAILHSISPEISIDYFAHLNFGKNILIISQYSSALRNGCWDNQLRGVGPPPIKTADGWLILYHAMDKYDPNKYKLGAMMLDYNDPTKILYRAINPILEPCANYENQGYKSGVIYACGAVVIDDRLFVYYGGADRVTCVVTVKMSDFLVQLQSCRMTRSTISMHTVKIIK
ncbi:MAG: hypothetical protein A3C55_04345 [Gammaproteobacteria bacterium RIFCSPHIGHO2_02_FULL_42_13]|nr:MAG: hypothetical protein A3C55_04345 [Gammaproteobacteria bacterium RIFCSPHIGHO2_02_FULL_42_13]OGT70756.1 MAG: hypothetical protein A3H43_05120 [Gammaproteobacteria bacterium RIFCSPLOWO2_02_FULL_42_9]